jgi:transcription antitermination factor NusB
MLFQMDLSGDAPEGVFDGFWEGQQNASTDVRAFAEELARGAWAVREVLDAAIVQSAEHWRLERMAAVDRNVLRLAAFELLYRPDTPPAVAIDEAIEIVRKYGSEESGRFINGILDGLRRRMESGELRIEGES